MVDINRNDHPGQHPFVEVANLYERRSIEQTTHAARLRRSCVERRQAPEARRLEGPQSLAVEFVAFQGSGPLGLDRVRIGGRALPSDLITVDVPFAWPTAYRNRPSTRSLLASSNAPD